MTYAPSSDQRSASAILRDRLLMASRIRASSMAATDREWNWGAEEAVRRKWISSAVGRSSVPLKSMFEKITEERLRPSHESTFYVMYWAGVMRAIHGDEWVAKVWDMRDGERDAQLNGGG